MREKKPLVVVITGASAGVGRATARAFGKKKAHIGLLARGHDGLEAARREVEAAGGKALAIPTDVAEYEQVEAAAEAVEREFGPIDIWVNNAMTTVFAPFLDTIPKDFHRATEVTYFGFVHGTLAALKRMAPRDRGTIVQVGSALAYRSIPLQSAYCGAKHAMVGFTDSIRSELIHSGSKVHITAVHLPGLNTPQFEWCKAKLERHPQPVPPIFQPEIAADAIVWASGKRRREVFVGLPTVMSVIGQKFLPGWLDGFLADKAWDGQFTEERIDAEHRPHNLYRPLPGDFGARGRFSERSRGLSLQWWVTKNAKWIGMLGLGAAGTLLTAYLTRKPTEKFRHAAEELREMEPTGRWR